ncbi:MAG: thymidylate kinase [Oscillospiraceae bacterium]|nr:thymidylate kinase [Oscillospiraceae bacterium]
MKWGKLIVIEGLDGCGKSTQLDLALGYLKEKNVNCRSVSFPNYQALSGKLVQQYLNGEIPCDGRNGAYAASAMYAVDRYISYMTDWKSFYENGGIVLSGRYTTSNAIYQLTKLPVSEHEYFLNWLCDFEYGKLGLPEPDLVIFLDMPIEVSQKLLDKRYLGDETKKDIHERNVEFLQECRKSALYTANQCGWKIIQCSDGVYPLPIEEVYAQICDCLKVLTEYA